MPCAHRDRLDCRDELADLQRPQAVQAFSRPACLSCLIWRTAGGMHSRPWPTCSFPTFLVSARGPARTMAFAATVYRLPT